MVEQNDKKPKLITIHEFYFETPLYEAINLSMLEDDFLEGEVDAYSAKNGIDTTYSITEYNMSENSYHSPGFSGFLKVKLVCKRKNNDILRFFLFQGDDFVVKVGQIPSLADLQFADIGKKYDKMLERPDLQEFKKAIGLAAHGVGAGSFVYLRRIFEKLIGQTFTEHESELDTAAKDFKVLRMDEKVQVLKKYLPEQLVEMKGVYKILSRGVHELTEQECLSYFPALKLSIELILEQKIEEEAKKARDVEAKKQIAAIEAQIKPGSEPK